MTARDRRDEEGSISTWAVLGALVLTICVGLAVDLGGQIHAKQHAYDIAAEAARTGAQQVAASAMTGRPLAVDPESAYWAATDYLTTSGVSGTVDTAEDLVTVTVHETYRPVFLGSIGIGDLNVTATATAHLVRTVGGNRT